MPHLLGVARRIPQKQEIIPIPVHIILMETEISWVAFNVRINFFLSCTFQQLSGENEQQHVAIECPVFPIDVDELIFSVAHLFHEVRITPCQRKIRTRKSHNQQLIVKKVTWSRILPGCCLYTKGYSTTSQSIKYILGLHIVTPEHDYSNVMCYVFWTEELGFLAIMMTEQRHNFFWIIVIGDFSYFHHVLTSFLDLLYMTEYGLHVAVYGARDVLIGCM
jgi:hypothetical protein